MAGKTEEAIEEAKSVKGATKPLVALSQSRIIALAAASSADEVRILRSVRIV